MRLFGIEHSRPGYVLDYVFYGTGIAVPSCLLVPHLRTSATVIAASAALGGLGWTLVEYLLHRFVLHRLQPFRRWHEAQHMRPRALVATAFTLGFLVGYLSYAVLHHGTHHWRADAGWMRSRKRWHVSHHHHHRAVLGCFGVTTGFWDRVFGTGERHALR